MKEYRTCCIVGHGPMRFCNVSSGSGYKPRGLNKWLDNTIEEAVQKGVVHFITGNAEGVDIWAAERILIYKKTHPDILLEIAIPYEGHNDDIPRIRNIQKRADFVTITSEDPDYHVAMAVNARYIVEKSDFVVAVCVARDGEIMQSRTQRVLMCAAEAHKTVIKKEYKDTKYKKRHHHWYQKYVSAGEIRRILEDMFRQDHLLCCILVKVDASNQEKWEYDEHLMAVCQKFAFVSSLFYLRGEHDVKPARKNYELFFEGYMENTRDARHILENAGANPDDAEAVLKKYNEIKDLSLQLLTDEKEVWRADEFRSVIEYVLARENEEATTTLSAKEIINRFPPKYAFDWGDFYH